MANFMNSSANTVLGCLRFYVHIDVHLSTFPAKMQRSRYHTLDLTTENLEPLHGVLLYCCDF